METNTIVENSRTQMRRGVLEYSILLVLRSGDEYASSIIQKLKDVDIIVVEGTLYPLLIRLKNLGMLSYRWEESPQGPPKILYDHRQGTGAALGTGCHMAGAREIRRIDTERLPAPSRRRHQQLLKTSLCNHETDRKSKRRRLPVHT